MDNKSLKEQSLWLIKQATITLISKGIKPTQKKVSSETGLSVITVKRYWHSFDESTPKAEKVSPEIIIEPKGTPASKFERLKRRLYHSTVQ